MTNYIERVPWKRLEVCGVIWTLDKQVRSEGTRLVGVTDSEIFASLIEKRPLRASLYMPETDTCFVFRGPAGARMTVYSMELDAMIEHGARKLWSQRPHNL